MSWKNRYIEQYGEKKYPKNIKDSKEWVARNPERQRASLAAWRAENPEKLKSTQREYRKGGKYYEQIQGGIPGERCRVRKRDGRKWQPYKYIIAPESQLHHQWVPETSSYRGLALVEKNQHMHGFIDVILILKGEITLYTEKEIRNRGRD